MLEDEPGSNIHTRLATTVNDTGYYIHSVSTEFELLENPQIAHGTTHILMFQGG